MAEVTNQKNTTTIAAIAAIVIVLGIIGFSVAKMNGGKTPEAPVAENNTPNGIAVGEPNPSTPEPTTTTATYKDGTYTAVGDYMSPGGAEEVGLTLTLKDGVITKTSFEQKATRPASVTFQKKFADGYEKLVVGKKIDEVQLDVVSGSSLTPKGFNDAVAKIKAEAKA